MQIKSKRLHQAILFGLLTITLILSILINANLVVIHDQMDALVSTNRMLALIGIPLSGFYLYLIYRMRHIKVFKILFYVALVLYIYSLIHTSFLYNPKLYLRNGEDINHSIYFYPFLFFVLAYFSFINKEGLATRIYFLFVLTFFWILGWFPHTMFGGILNINMYFEMSTNNVILYVIASYVNMIIFFFLIEDYNKKMVVEEERLSTEQKDFSFFMKNKK